MMPSVELQITTPGQGLHEITSQIQQAATRLLATINEDKPDTANPTDGSGLCTVFIRHTSASLTIQENADPSARRDLENWLARLVPENDPLYTHTDEGPDDMPSHIKAVLTSTSIGIPLIGGRLGLGRWQGIYLWEHRRHTNTRRVIVHVGV